MLEKALYLWVQDMQKSIAISSLFFKEKVKDLEENIMKEEGEYPDTGFVVSKGIQILLRLAHCEVHRLDRFARLLGSADEAQVR